MRRYGIERRQGSPPLHGCDHIRYCQFSRPAGYLVLDCGPRRGVAQSGSAPVWGTGGRRFKSGRPDQFPRTNRLPLRVSAPDAGSIVAATARALRYQSDGPGVNRRPSGRAPVWRNAARASSIAVRRPAAVRDTHASPLTCQRPVPGAIWRATRHGSGRDSSGRSRCATLWIPAPADNLSGRCRTTRR